MKRTTPLAAYGLLLACVAFLSPKPMSAQDATGPRAILADKSYVTPPGSIADAALAPRYLNVTPTNVSPDRSAFIHEIGDGPVDAVRFSRDFDELGGDLAGPIRWRVGPAQGPVREPHAQRPCRHHRPRRSVRSPGPPFRLPGGGSGVSGAGHGRHRPRPS